MIPSDDSERAVSGGDMNSAVSVRPYLPADLDALVGIFLGAIREVAAKDYDAAQIAAWAQVDREKFAARCLGTLTWVAVIDRFAVGFSNLEPDGHLDMMYVHPAHQSRGTATALLAQVEKSARAQALPRIFTEASITARSFFERRGFQILTSQLVLSRGQTLMNFKMEKLLS